MSARDGSQHLGASCEQDPGTCCRCEHVDRHALAVAVDRMAGERGFFAHALEDRPHLFADVAVRLPEADYEAMTRLVGAAERAAGLEGFRALASSWSPDVFGPDAHGAGLFMGYDFHLTPDGPRLIEINTNAGGAFFCAVAAAAACACAGDASGTDRFEAAVTDAFRREWRLAGRSGPLSSVVIVDDAPTEQPLAPEFALARAVLKRAGIAASIADASELAVEGGALRLGGRPVDLVYNRVTDFALADPTHAALRRAYAEGLAVVSPSPRHHALLANKSALAVLSDPERLKAIEVSVEDRAALEVIPRTRRAREADADALWAERKRLVFKPAASHASKGVYRGDKITRGAFAQVLAGDYVAQALVPPSERTVVLDGAAASLKLDVRLYTHAGHVLQTAARIYQGQVTNMRTEGGGFAPVLQDG